MRRSYDTIGVNYSNLRKPDSRIDLRVSRIDGGLRYLATIPLDAIQLTPEALKHGITFNLIVNDTDLENKREGFAKIADGLGTNKDPSLYPVIQFE